MVGLWALVESAHSFKGSDQIRRLEKEYMQRRRKKSSTKCVQMVFVGDRSEIAGSSFS